MRSGPVSVLAWPYAYLKLYLAALMMKPARSDLAYRFARLGQRTNSGLPAAGTRPHVPTA